MLYQLSYEQIGSINKSDSRYAVVRFCYHSYDNRPNWTPLGAITITKKNHIFIARSALAVKMLFLSFTCDDIGVAMVTDMIGQFFELEEHSGRFAKVSESNVKKIIEGEENLNSKK